jgi:ribosome-binding protein aMBF1 (putative translation factor)
MLTLPHVRAVALGSKSPAQISPAPTQAHFRESRSITARISSSYADHGYILRVIAYLKRERINQGLSLKTLTTRAGIRKGLINRAEREGFIPKTSEFKAWATALGLSWERVWSLTFPKRGFPQT